MPARDLVGWRRSMPPSRATAANVQKKKSTLKDYTGEVKQELQMDPHSCALIAAARRGDVLFGMLAMDAGDTVNTVNNEEETALHIALDSSKQDFALWLLSRGANPCLKDSRGQDCRLWANEIMGVRAALHRAKEREERGALAPQSADVMALADHLGVAGAGDEHLVWVAEAALNGNKRCNMCPRLLCSFVRTRAGDGLLSMCWMLHMSIALSDLCLRPGLD